MEICLHVFEKSGRQTDRRGSFIYIDWSKIADFNLSHLYLRVTRLEFRWEFQFGISTGVPNRARVGSFNQTAIFDQCLAISQKRCKIGT